jgi:hypothetical protein
MEGPGRWSSPDETGDWLKNENLLKRKSSFSGILQGNIKNIPMMRIPLGGCA